MTGWPDSRECYCTTMLMIVVNLSKLTTIISTHSALDTMDKRTNYLCKVHNICHSLKLLPDALWSKKICPTAPTSKDLDFLQCYEQYLLSVNGATKLQKGIISGQAHVSWLQLTQFRAADSLKVEVRKEDDHYVGIWLSGMKKHQIWWYLKESTSCSIMCKINSLKHD